MRLALAAMMLGLALGAEPPSSPSPQPTLPGAQRGGRGRPPIVQMTISSPAWHDGDAIPAAHAQSEGDRSPPLTWSGVPEDTTSFALIVHDLDAPVSSGTDDRLHWLVWNIPGPARSLPAGIPDGPTLPDGSRQISATGHSYRGPAVAVGAAVHHYVFELYALDTLLDVPAIGASPAETRAAVMTAMAGHVRGKAICIGTFARGG